MSPQAYRVRFFVTDSLETDVIACNQEQALRIAKLLRDEEGTYEGAFEVTNSELSEIEVVS